MMLRKFLASLTALALLIAPTLAGVGGFNAPGGQLAGFWGVLNPPPSISFQACTGSATNETTTTFSSHAVGTEDETRKTVVGFVSGAGANVNVNTVTVGGVTADEIGEKSFNNGSRGFYIVDNPAGTSEDIVVTTAASHNNLAICVWALYESDFSFPTSSSLDGDGGGAVGDPVPLDLDLRKNSVTLAVVNTFVSATFAWTGLTERADTAVAAEMWFSAADTTQTDATDNFNIEADPTAGNNDGYAITFSDDHSAPIVYIPQCFIDVSAPTTSTITNMSVGVPHFSRISAVLVAAEDGATNFNFSGVTLGGNSMTEATETGTAALIEAAVYHFTATNPTGDEATVATTMSEAVLGVMTCTFAIYHATTATPNDSQVNTTTTGASISGSVDTVENGVVTVICLSDVTDTGPTVAGFDDHWINQDLISTAGDEDKVAAETPRTISCDHVGATVDAGIASASWD